MVRKQHRLLVDSILLGVVGALSAQVFVFLLRWCQTIFLGWIAHYQPPGADGSLGLSTAGAHTLWWIPLSTTLGGLIAGIIVYSLAPEAEGHGTDAAVNAFHNLRGVIRSRVPFIKMVASAITIGSGGSAGREGPTALITAGVASIYAQKTGRTEREARLLLLVGMAAGLSAIFRSPIGTAIFAIEVLYSDVEFESGALVFTLLGSIVAYAVNGFFVGFRPLFEVPATLAPPSAIDYGWYAVLGVACGAVATILPMALYGVRDLFHKISCAPHFKPAIAGCLVGLMAVAFPQLLGGGYGWIQAAINGSLPATLLAARAPRPPAPQAAGRPAPARAGARPRRPARRPSRRTSGGPAAGGRAACALCSATSAALARETGTLVSPSSSSMRRWPSRMLASTCSERSRAARSASRARSI